ncbi:MAG: cobyrinate a,c-diamide synthase [Gammaproteobacteria bacterium]|nr:cobyrinate a,c-diamide synthase [Gammaproteobacteria bacterium]
MINAPSCGFFVSAPWRSSGKTVVSLGLSAEARYRGIALQTFKKGPDYIDPRWLAVASGAPCYNLDLHQQSVTELKTTYVRQSLGYQATLVEGTMGLHDGVASDGSDSNAAVAKLLQLPVVLVVDCRGMHRTIAALVNGLQEFDPELNFQGVILNRTRSVRHAQKIENAISGYSDIKLLGIIPDSDDLHIAEKELGLIPTADHDACLTTLDSIRQHINAGVDVDSLFPVSAPAHPQIPDALSFTRRSTSKTARYQNTRIGVAQDDAFHFYYQDDIDQFIAQGAELIECSPCRDSLPADLDGFWIGGGFPERYAEQLSGNRGFRDALLQAVRQGLPVHAECGGLMYLCRNLECGDTSWPMVGVIDADVSMSERPQGRGYMQLQPVEGAETPLPAHEFHHSRVSFHSQPDYVYRVKRGFGVDGQFDGIRCQNVVASYAHFRHTERTPWVTSFLARVDTNKQSYLQHHV